MHDELTRSTRSTIGPAFPAFSLAAGLGTTTAAAMPRTQAASEQTTRAVEPKDRPFLEMLARDNQAEIDLAQLAEQKADSKDVKEFASKILKDHQDAKTRLETVAAQAGVQLPPQLDDDQLELKQQLSTLSGATFDREYLDAMVAAHTAAVAVLELESRQGDYEPASGFAKSVLPTIQDHLARARKLDAQMDRQQSRSQ